MDITQVLLAAQSHDGQLRTVAEENLKQFQQQNFPHFLQTLSVELSNDEKPPESRRLAGILLKNSLDAKESTRKEEFVQRWMNVDPAIKSQVKESLLITLGSPVFEARRSSSQVIAKVAAIEIPHQGWPELIVNLLTNMTKPDAPPCLKQATLDCLGYVCEEISPEDLEQDQVNAVLTAVVQGMNHVENNSDVRLAAVKALYNALDFAETNFQNELERNYIMKVVCETAMCKEADIRKAAFECLVSIASIYYDLLEPYMQTIFELTSNAARVDEEPVALQAVEFWSTICDEEIARQEESKESGVFSSSCHFHFIEKALPSLVPMLLETLMKQEEDQDQDDGIWNISMSGGTCLGLVAITVQDAIVPLVIPFIEGNITKPDWHSREAATFAFGSILEGPSVQKLTPLVHAGFDFLLNATKDQNNHVKDTTAWTLSRIFEFLHSPTSGFSVVTDANVPYVIQILLTSIKDSPNVSEKICGAVYFLAQGYEDAGSISSVLTPYLGEIISALLATADRSDSNNSRLCASAYETLNEIVRCSHISENLNMIVQLLQEILKRLNQTFEIQITSSDDKEKQSDLQALLCGVAQVILQKFSSCHEKSAILHFADQMMVLFLRVFSCNSSNVHEEAMLAIGALAYATGPEFVKYMPEFHKYLEMGLQNFGAYQVCCVSVGVVGDICHALDDKVLPYCDGIMSALLKDLSSPELHRSVKPPILSCIGDIALTIGEHFEKYVPYTMPMLQGAAELCFRMDAPDDDSIEYQNELSRSIFEAYSGILQGFKNSKSELMVPYAGNIFQFVELVLKDNLLRNESVTKAGVAMVGDLADALGPNIKLLFKDSKFHSELLGQCCQSDDEQLRETASWVQGVITRVLVS
ncbi:hypothetical protein OsI_11135 [Oryza sativa Indica Group]|uniref:Importin N-terminal domain-containing protein n=2 Tax=Oryza TaxID=4527 RepID=A0A0E0GL56_ORYNI|nr:hypothetical protein OsI_11135 [Oryza sativa Indica Group]